MQYRAVTQIISARLWHLLRAGSLMDLHCLCFGKDMKFTRTNCFCFSVHFHLILVAIQGLYELSALLYCDDPSGTVKKHWIGHISERMGHCKFLNALLPNFAATYLLSPFSASMASKKSSSTAAAKSTIACPKPTTSHLWSSV